MSGFAQACRPFRQERSKEFEPPGQQVPSLLTFDVALERSPAMNRTAARLSAGLVLAAACAASAQAEYRCDPAPSWVDRAACKAADQGPNELRRFVEAMDSIRINIRFEDYVSPQLASRWDSQRAQLAQPKTTDEPQKVASTERR
jgi:hypothetical protein